MNKFFGDKLSFPHFLYLLPAFFVFHGYVENIEAMNPGDGFFLFGKYLLATIIIFAVAFLLFRSQKKAAILTFCIMAFHFFFGAVHDALKKIIPNTFIVQYSFILPVTVIALILLIIILRKTNRSFRTVSHYLNLLLLVLLAIEIPRLIFSSNKEKSKTQLANTSICDTCQKPDIYFIIADEYADSASLQEVFQYNNTGFQSALRQRGFHIINKSISNYNFTTYAMASIFQMNYLQGMSGRNSNLSDRNKCYDLVNHAPLWDFFKAQGYQLKNHSTFNIDNIPTEAPLNYILIGADMIVSQTFLSRLNRDVRYHLVTTFKIESEIKRISYFVDGCNQELLSRLLEEPTIESKQPKFVYAHLTMPHYPYYFKKDGSPNPLELLAEGNQVRQKEYMEYLQYCNGIFIKTIDSIQKTSKTPPIIMFMSDHGFREFDKDIEKNAKFYFMNLNSIYLPDKNYSKFYEGISSVNQFRALLNTSFNQNLPMLKDSTIFYYD